MTGGRQTMGRVEAVQGRDLEKSVMWAGHDGADVPAVLAKKGLRTGAAPCQEKAEEKCEE